MISQPKTRYQSLVGFCEGTKDMTRDEAHQSAQAEYAILFDWISKTPDAEKIRPPQEIEQLVNYLGHLKQLLAQVGARHFLRVRI